LNIGEVSMKQLQGVAETSTKAGFQRNHLDRSGQSGFFKRREPLGSSEDGGGRPTETKTTAVIQL
jgi:hypothetical protein